ncbi:MAG: hypothetical protein IPL84_05895 [Chitinophagaceae bacterium]|nr:hypothetical protein [Chitinophagaceae bacterium]
MKRYICTKTVMPDPKNIETPESLLKKREKRKWQIALRRYVLEKKPSGAYAKYFGLDIEFFREWISLQFKDGLSWGNFAEQWQFDHIVPVAYFDFSKEEDLQLCWNFINIRVESVDYSKTRGNRIDVMGVRNYFEDLFEKTKYPFCLKMLDKIKTIEVASIENNRELEAFILKNRDYFEQIASLNKNDFQRLNDGLTFKSILAEKEILRKYGG